MIVTPPPRSSHRRALSTVALVALGCVALSSCSSNQQSGGGTQQEGGTLTVALGGDVKCLDPWQTDVPAENNIYRQQVETLTSIDPDNGTLRPWLAQSWKPNADATRFEFTLRDGVHFSDGTELTSQVIKQNFDLAATLPQAVRGPSYLGGYTGTEITDNHTFTVTFKSPNASFLNRTSSNFLGVLAPKTLEASAENRCAQGVIGTGPFTLDSYQPNQQVVLTKRDNYDSAPSWANHQGAAHLDKIVFSLVPESSSRIGLLTSGQAEVVQSLEAQDFAAAKSSGASVQSRVTPGIPLRLQINTADSFFGDRAVRQALSYYIDREDINQVVFEGSSEPSAGLLTVNVPGYLDQSSTIHTDKAAGDKLLQGAGWAKNSSGIWEKDGQPLSFHITKASPYTSSKPLLELVVQQLHSAGVQADFADYVGDFAQLTANHQYSVLFSNTTDIDGDVLRGQLSPLSGNRANLPADNPITAPLTQQNQIGNVDERNALLKNIQKTVIDEGYQIPIAPVIQFYGIAASVTGVQYDVESRLYLYDAALTA